MCIAPWFVEMFGVCPWVAAGGERELVPGDVAWKSLATWCLDRIDNSPVELEFPALLGERLR